MYQCHSQFVTAHGQDKAMKIRLRRRAGLVARPVVVAAGIAICQLPSLHAQTGEVLGRFAAIDRYVQANMGRFAIPGAEVGIVQDGRTVYLNGFGQADDTGRAMTPQTPVLLASVTKSFTALSIMQLVEGGQVDLDAPVQRYLPWFRTSDPRTSSRITLRELLNHTSGFSTREGLDPYVDARLEGDRLEAYVRSLSGARLTAAPGGRFQYSNTNYSVLGLIVQDVLAARMHGTVQANVFDPLRMIHSHASPAAARADNGAAGYYPFFGRPVVSDDIPITRAFLPAAGLYSTAQDMTHYLIAQLEWGAIRRPSPRVRGQHRRHAPSDRSREQREGLRDGVGGWLLLRRHQDRHPAWRRGPSLARLCPAGTRTAVWCRLADQH